jgi:alkylation response protein AidB-like acyl-CoA dehydrogenase
VAVHLAQKALDASVAYAKQRHGSYGRTREFPQEPRARDARRLTMPEGTTQVHELIIDRELTGLRAFSQPEPATSAAPDASLVSARSPIGCA